MGRVNTGTETVSVAVMESPQGWEEPGQTPAFDEYTVVLEGRLVVESHDGPPLSVGAGQAVHTPAGQWVRYSTPDPGGARYVAVCSPAFSPTRFTGTPSTGCRPQGRRRGITRAGYRRGSCSPSPSGSATPPTPAS